MKFPKHRSNCYVVERHIKHPTLSSQTVIGVFPTAEGADCFKDACQQDWHDRGFFDEGNFVTTFVVTLATYYDA